MVVYHQLAGVCGLPGQQGKAAVCNGLRKIKRTSPISFKGMNKILEDHGALAQRDGR